VLGPRQHVQRPFPPERHPDRVPVPPPERPVRLQRIPHHPQPPPSSFRSPRPRNTSTRDQSHTPTVNPPRKPSPTRTAPMTPHRQHAGKRRPSTSSPTLLIRQL